ncbi:ATP-binding protein [Candidatus Omnitrophota bacterium]
MYNLISINYSKIYSMNEHIIKFPKGFLHYNFDGVMARVKEIEELPDKGIQKVVFDLRGNEVISVLGTLLMASSADRLIKKGYKCFVQYPKQRGWFLKSMGIIKEDFEQYLDGIRVPIQRCFTEEESMEAINKKVIPMIREEIKPAIPVLKAINWAIWEAVANSITHGYCLYDYEGRLSDPIYCCAFNYKEFIEVAILDSGRGIQRSFLESGKEKYKDVENEQALRLSIQNTESGHPQGSPGFGLFGCAELAKNTGGDLVVISGGNKLYLSERELELKPCFYYAGTMIKLSIPAQFDLDLTKVFNPNNIIVTEDIDFLTGDFDE